MAPFSPFLVAGGTPCVTVCGHVRDSISFDISNLRLLGGCAVQRYRVAEHLFVRVSVWRGLCKGGREEHVHVLDTQWQTQPRLCSA